MKNQMRRSLAVLLAVLMLVCAIPFAASAATVTCPTCKKNALTDEVVHEAATCTTPGYSVIKCSDPTCAGKRTAIAGEPALGHAWKNDPAEKFLKDAAYCNGPAVYYKSCERCGISAKDDATVTEKTFEHGGKDENNHRNVEVYKAEKPATCTAIGQTAIGTCKDCGKLTGGDDIPMLPHTVGTPANCVDLAVCAVCSQSFGTVDATNHKSIVTDTAVAPTCTATGLTEGKHCEACGTTTEAQQEVAKTNHTATTRNEAPSCIKDGVQNEVYCSVCGQIITAGTTLPATGHTWGKWTAPAGYDCAVGGKVTRECTVCHIKDEKTVAANAHVLVEDPAVKPTCTETGLTKGSHCEICNQPIEAQTTVPALDHSFTGDVIPVEGGKHSFKCIRCEEVGGTANCVDANSNCVCDVCDQRLAHKFTNYQPDGNATCVADGTKTATCDVCGIKSEPIADEGSHETAPHQYTFVAQNDAKCLENAHEVGTCALCGNTVTREIENSALGHIMPANWQYPDDFSCPLGGYRFKICEREGCGMEIARENVDPAEHTRVTDPAVAVTCTEDGKTEGEHCAVCGEVFIAQAVIPHEGHKADDKGFTVKTAATCTTDGIETATCAKCGQEFEQTIPKTGHTYVATVVAPGCTTKGYTLHKCIAGDDEYKDTVTKATGHSWKITVKQATLKKDGSKNYVCTVCKTKVTKVIDKVASVKLSETLIAKDGQKHAPTVTVKNSQGKTLKKGTAYTVKYSAGRKIIGTYTVTVTFIGNYSGTKTLKFSIVPAAPKTVKATAGSKSATLKWSKVSGGDKYIVYYSTAKNGTYKKALTTDKTGATVKNLKSGTTYYFKVKAVRVLDSGNLNGIASAAAKAKVK